MSITLTAAEINQLIIGGVAVETDAVAAVTNIVIDFVGQTATFQVLKGSIVNGAFIPGQLQQGSFSITISLVTGAWTTTSGLSGALTTQGLSTAISTTNSYRDSTEAMANSIVYNGTLVPW
jgi:hypothetical protein